MATLLHVGINWRSCDISLLLQHRVVCWLRTKESTNDDMIWTSRFFWFIPYKSVGWFPCARKDATASPRKKHPTWFLTVSCPFSPVAFLPFSLFSFLLAPPILFHSLNRRDVFRYIPARCQRIQMDVFGDGQVAVQRLMDEILFPQRVNAGILMTSMTSNIFKKWLSISRQSRMSIILFFTFGLLSSNQVIIVAPTW